MVMHAIAPGLKRGPFVGGRGLAYSKSRLLTMPGAGVRLARVTMNAVTLREAPTLRPSLRGGGWHGPAAWRSSLVALSHEG